jgi:hypothetical protein
MPTSYPPEAVIEIADSFPRFLTDYENAEENLQRQLNLDPLRQSGELRDSDRERDACRRALDEVTWWLIVAANQRDIDAGPLHELRSNYGREHFSAARARVEQLRFKAREEVARAYEKRIDAQGNSPRLGSETQVSTPEGIRSAERVFDAYMSTGIAKPVLHPDDVKILRALASSSTTQSQYGIEAASGLSRRTISDRLAALRAAGLTQRPNGIRGGEAITDAGRAAIPADGTQAVR